MEIRNHPPHDVEVVARGDDDLRRANQRLQPMPVQIIQNVLQRVVGGEPVVLRVVGIPLFHHQLVARGVLVVREDDAHIVQALQRADGGRPDGDDVPQLLLDVRYRTPFHRDIFRVHLVPLDGLALHGLEGPRPDVERYLLAPDAAPVDVGQDFGREVQARRGCGDRPFYLRIDCLVGRQVALLGLAVQVGRDGQDTGGVEQVREGESLVVPREVDAVAVAVALLPLGAEDDGCAADLDGLLQHALLPFFQVSDEANPATALGLLENLRIVARQVRFEAKDLDAGAGRLLEEEARLDNPRVVIYQQRILRQIFADVLKLALFDGSLPVNQQLGLVALRERKLGYPFVGQWIVVFFDSYLFRVVHLYRFFLNKPYN